MSRQGKWEYLKAIHARYRQAARAEKGRILDEFCHVTRYHRKSALRLLHGPPPGRRPPPRRRRPPRYGSRVIQVLAAIWRAAGYPWSVRLQALLPLWLPWARARFRLTPAIEAQLLALSPRQMDRRLAPHRQQVQKRLYGRTKPGTLLKHHIPLRTDRWDVTVPDFTEVDLVAHSGESGEGEFLHSLNVTDIHTTWVETRAVLGRGQAGVQQALEEMRQALPFALRGIDSDNGSEFINGPPVPVLPGPGSRVAPSRRLNLQASTDNSMGGHVGRRTTRSGCGATQRDPPHRLPPGGASSGRISRPSSATGRRR